MTPHISATHKRLTGVKEMEQVVDPRTSRGMAELIQAFGEHKAWSARIAALEGDIASELVWNRWVLDPQHTLQKRLAYAKFELAYLNMKDEA